MDPQRASPGQDGGQETAGGGFWVLSALLGVVVFWGNHHHLFNQGNSTYQRSLMLAQHLASGLGYTLDQPSGVPAFFPMWGYPLMLVPGVLAGQPQLWITAVQFLLSLMALRSFYRAFGLAPRMWHIPLLLPLFALGSVKWADAFTLPLTLLLFERLTRFLSQGGMKAGAGSAVVFGLLVNFRSEFLLLPFALASVALARQLGGHRARWLLLSGGLLAGGVLFLTPWAIRSHALLGCWRLASTNGGGVLYVTLGQLPDNPWGLRHSDAEAWDYVMARGEGSPWSPSGDLMLRAAWKECVATHPLAFVGKLACNGLRLATHGVYTGEYYTLATTPQSAHALLREWRAHPWQGLWHPQDPVTSLLWVGSAVLYACFLVLLAMALPTAIFHLCKRGHAPWPGAPVVMGLLVHSCGVVMLAQHQTRHANIVYLLSLGVVLRLLALRRTDPVEPA